MRIILEGTAVANLRTKACFLYFKFADSRDVLYHESCFDNEDYKLLTQCLQWQRCRNNLLKVKEMQKLSGTCYVIISGNLRIASVLRFKRAKIEAPQFSRSQEARSGSYRSRSTRTLFFFFFFYHKPRKNIVEQAIKDFIGK